MYLQIGLKDFWYWGVIWKFWWWMNGFTWIGGLVWREFDTKLLIVPNVGGLLISYKNIFCSCIQYENSSTRFFSLMALILDAKGSLSPDKDALRHIFGRNYVLITFMYIQVSAPCSLIFYNRFVSFRWGFFINDISLPLFE